MVSKKFTVAVLGLFVAATSFVFAADKPKLDGIKCVVATNKAVDESKSAEWKKGKVYFCCGNCPKAFSANKEKHAARANAQLVATKQYKQTACPLSGAKLNPETAIEVAGTKVSFCCNNCKGKAEAAKDAEQVELVFGEKAFEKGKFELVKEEVK
jgi:hypothetical protein